MGDLARRRARLEDLAPVVVAFSGGADSAFLAWVANDTLGAERVLAGPAVPPSLAAGGAGGCAARGGGGGLVWATVAADELARADYVANGTDRCFHCKTELMDAVGPLAAAEGATVVLGGSVGDL